MAVEPTFRILLVDDEPVICELVRAMLVSPTVEVEVASDGDEALRRARACTFDLILLDVVLPGMDGINVCRTLRSESATARKPIYMLTAKAKPADVETALQAGADGHISKPFRGAELLELVAALQRREGRRQAGE
jgi:DNA-binding response OmpR family regulator